VDGVAGCTSAPVVAGGVTVDVVSTARVSVAFSVFTEQALKMQISANAL